MHSKPSKDWNGGAKQKQKETIVNIFEPLLKKCFDVISPFCQKNCDRNWPGL